MKAELLLPGDNTSLYVLTGSKCWVREYIDSLETQDESRLIARLNKIAKNGPPRNNPDQFKPLEDGIFEIKSFQARLFCFYDKNRRHSLVITHGVKKKTQKLPKKEIERAKELRNAYYQEK